MTGGSRNGGGRGLEARGLTKRYASVAVVRAVDVVVRPGEVIGYLGPNGSGKTTTVRMVTGLTEPSEGTVLHDGRSIFGAIEQEVTTP